MAKMISVVHSATQRALRCSASPSPRITVMNRAPTSGRKVMTDRTGQLMSAHPNAKHEPGDQGGDADQHGKGVVIEVTGLQSHDATGHVEHARRDAVGAPAVDQPAVAVLPQDAAEPQRRADD